VITGRKVPVSANTTKKKNSHRGPNVGNDVNTTKASPAQPINPIIKENGRTDRKGGKRNG